MSYCVRLKSSPPHVVGPMGATQLPEIGYCYHPSVWGQGYATEALKAWIEIYWATWTDGFPGLNMDKRECLVAQTGPQDKKSPRVLQKCGLGLVEQEEVEENDKIVMLDQWRMKKPARDA